VHLEDTETSHRSALSLSQCIGQNACQPHYTPQRDARLSDDHYTVEKTIGTRRVYISCIWGS